MTTFTPPRRASTDEIQRAPRLPWRPEDTRRACRGRVLVRLRDVREHVPHAGDVALGARPAALRFDLPAVDRAIGARSAAMRVSRPYSAARNVGAVGRRHQGWADDELSLGLARTFRVDLDPDASVLELVTALGELSEVESASPVYLADCPFAASADDELLSGGGEDALADAGAPATDWSAELVRAYLALDAEPGDPALIVAVIDSGVATDHPELWGRCRAGADLVDLPEADLSRGIHLLGDYSRRDNRPYDELGHGTACAGILGARGVHLPPGLAGASPILPMRALAAAKIADRPRPTALGTLPDIDVAVKLAVDLGARVLNLSFGTPESALRPGDPVPHLEVVEYALGRGCVLVAASGNSGDSTRYFPAALPGVIAVAAVGPDGRPTAFSTRGDHVALAAPGQRLRCAGLTGLTTVSGTSFAAPFVAGAAALVLAAAARRLRPLTPFEVRELLVRSARPFADEAPGCGAGVLDAAAAVAMARALSAAASVEPEPEGAPEGTPEGAAEGAPDDGQLHGQPGLAVDDGQPARAVVPVRAGSASTMAPAPLTTAIPATSTMGLETPTVGTARPVASHLGRGADRPQLI